MKITTQRARPASPACDSDESRKNRTKNDSRISKGIAMESGIFIEGRMEGSRHCFSLTSWRDFRKKDQKNFRRKPVDLSPEVGKKNLKCLSGE